MPAFVPSDLTPFTFETQRRGDPGAASRTTLARAERDAGMRLLRAPANPRDESLSSLAQAWRDAFAPDQQPLALCTRYPRLANRIALCWADRTLALQLLKQLLTDRRGGRQGFPVEVKRELMALNSASPLREAGRPLKIL